MLLDRGMNPRVKKKGEKIWRFGKFDVISRYVFPSGGTTVNYKEGRRERAP